MILIESAVHILHRVKCTHYLPNKQPELHTAMTFLSLRAGCVDSCPRRTDATPLFLVPFLSVRKRAAATWMSLPNCLNVRCKDRQHLWWRKRELSFMICLHTHSVWIDRRGAKSPLLMVCSLLS